MPTSKPDHARAWLALTGLVIILDQASKWWAEISLLLHQPVPVMPMLNITLAHNTGAAFSFLSGAGGWQRWFFISLTILVCIVLFAWLWRLRAEEKLHAVSLALILGGAIGNLIDRLWLGFVIDFIDVYYDVYHWPVFNIADSTISIGVALLIMDTIFYGDRAKDSHESDSA